MNRNILAKPVGGTAGIYIALAAALVAALAAIVLFGDKKAEAAEDDIKVDPISVNLGEVATGSVETTTVDITNRSDEIVKVGAIDLSLLEGQLGDLNDLDFRIIDLEGNELLDLESLLDLLGILDLEDLLGAPLELADPLELQPGETVQLVIDIVPETAGAIELNIDLLNDLIRTILPAPIQIIGNAQDCTISGTDGDNTLTDTPGDDVICGKGGNDTITAPNGGDDVVLGQEGNDTISLKDGVKKNDLANGGSGRDVCKKDKKDKVQSCGKSQRRAR
jgi:Ca2+-binding RTX toxin-like protein